MSLKTCSALRRSSLEATTRPARMSYHSLTVRPYIVWVLLSSGGAANTPVPCMPTSRQIAGIVFMASTVPTGTARRGASRGPWDSNHRHSLFPANLSAPQASSLFIDCQPEDNRKECQPFHGVGDGADFPAPVLLSVAPDNRRTSSAVMSRQWPGLSPLRVTLPTAVRTRR